MRLDMAAQRALHVLPARGEARGNSTSSVYGILNHTRTAMGKRLLRSWLKQPLTDVAAITERHAVVQAFVDDLEMRCDPPTFPEARSCLLASQCYSASV
jgi:DNA mismatch repair protein MSH2